MSVNLEQITAKYIELRDRKTEMAKKHQDEMAPLNTAMETIENWFLNQMQAEGVDSYKTPAGTAFRKVTSSVTMADHEAFKEFVFLPAAQQVVQFMGQMGYISSAPDRDALAIIKLLNSFARWGLVDFRSGKKGIEEFIQESNETVPGVNISQYTTVNVRRASA